MWVVMIQGIGLNVGKLFFVVGLCWVVWVCGMLVVFFKLQNMLNNVVVIVDGGEIGCVQVLQVFVVGFEFLVYMNLVFLKFEIDWVVQVIVQGWVVMCVVVVDYGVLKVGLMLVVMDSFV